MIRSIIASQLFAISLSATVINVPADQATIQAGIDAAVDGDTVLVQPGIFVENINFNGKNIVLGSLFLTTQDTSYISSTIIDGNQNGSVVMINSGESSMAMLAGFTIQNGTGTPYPDSEIFRGSGLFLENSSPVVDHCIIQNNVGHSGIGAFVHLGQPTFTNCAFQGNTNIGNQNNGQNECVIFNGWTASEYIVENPEDFGHRFRKLPDSDSVFYRTVIPEDIGHFRCVGRNNI